ncbi:AAA family ATPase [bacterium]|nr:AAA family ATPase [bacterium]
MYEAYWGLSDSPFTNRLSPRWFHESPVHEEALARLFYLIEHRRGFGVISGDAGTGKSLTLRVLSEQSLRSQRRVAFIDLLGMDEHEMLWQLAVKLRLSPAESDSRWSLWRRITDQLASLELAKQQAVFVFDHLERAEPSCLGLLERLFCAADSGAGLATFIASLRSEGVPRASCFVSEMTDLRVELLPLQLDETDEFVHDLLQQAGCDREIFSGDALLRLHALSQGIPRSICRICEMALIAGMASNLEAIDGELIDSVSGSLVEAVPAAAVEHHEYV